MDSRLIFLPLSDVRWSDGEGKAFLPDGRELARIGGARQIRRGIRRRVVKCRSFLREKLLSFSIREPVLKPTQVGEERILRCAR